MRLMHHLITSTIMMKGAKHIETVHSVVCHPQLEVWGCDILIAWLGLLLL